MLQSWASTDVFFVNKQVCNHAFDFTQNCTPLSAITITYVNSLAEYVS